MKKLKMKKIEFQAYIKIRAKPGVSAQTITDELVLANGNQAPKYSRVTKWASQFMDGRESLEDDPRSDRPHTTYTAENIERVRAIIEEDLHATHDIIEDVTSLNHFKSMKLFTTLFKKK